MGHVSNNIGGVYENHKTYDQEGAVYTLVSKDHQRNGGEFLHKELFETPQWMIDKDLFSKIEYSGAVERIRSMQERTLNNILSLGKMARLIEQETLYGSKALSLVEMTSSLRKGIWSELYSGKSIDTYRRNLQKAHIDRLGYLLTAKNQSKQPDWGGYIKSTAVNTSQSDIRSVAKAELINLKNQINSSKGNFSDQMSRYHLDDSVSRINELLDPK
jgi:hypothetical protein